MDRMRRRFLTSYDRLRYRLMPYIYSLAWMTTNEAYTPMRPLAMDYPDGHARAEYRRSIHVWAGAAGESGDGAGRDDAANVFAEGELV